MLSDLVTMCRELGLDAQEILVKGPKGQAKSLGVKHGKFNIFAVESGKNVATLMLVIEFEDSDAAVLARQSPEVLGRLQAVLRREMMEGRSGYAILPHPKHPQGMGQIRVEQRIVVGLGPTEKQRLLDATQELATVATRCMSVLGHAFSAIEASSMQHPDYSFV